MSTIDEVEARLAARAEEPLPESWIPQEAGQRLIGRVRRYEKGTTQGWGDAPICVVESLRNPGRLASIWIFHTALVNAFKREQPKRGETIMVEYGGKIQPEGGGQSYHGWKLVVDRDATSEGLDFGAAFDLAGQASPPESQPPQDGAHTTYDAPADWNTTGNADDRAPAPEFFGDGSAEDDIPF